MLYQILFNFYKKIEIPHCLICTVDPYKYFCLGLDLTDSSQMEERIEKRVEDELNQLYGTQPVPRWVLDTFFKTSENPNVMKLRAEGQGLGRVLSRLESDLSDAVDAHKTARAKHLRTVNDNGERVIACADKINGIKADIMSYIEQAQKLYDTIQSIEAGKVQNRITKAQNRRKRWRHTTTKNAFRGNYPKMAATVLNKKLYPSLKALMCCNFPSAYIRTRAIRRSAKNAAKKAKRRSKTQQAYLYACLLDKIKAKIQAKTLAGSRYGYVAKEKTIPQRDKSIPRLVGDKPADLGEAKGGMYVLKNAISDVFEAERVMRENKEKRISNKRRTRSECKTATSRNRSTDTMLLCMWDGMSTHIHNSVADLQRYAKFESVAVQRLCTILKTDAKTVYGMFRLVGPAIKPADPIKPADLTTWSAIHRLRISTLRETTYFVELLLKHLRPASSVAYSIERILNKYDSVNAKSDTDTDTEPGCVGTGRQILCLYSKGPVILSACSKILKAVTLLRNAKIALKKLERHKIAGHLTRVYKHTICELNRQLAKRCRAITTFGLKSRPDTKSNRSVDAAKEFGVAYGRAVQKLETRARNVGLKMSSYVQKLDPAIVARSNLLLRLAKHDSCGSVYQIPINPQSRTAQHFQALSDSYYVSVLKTGVAKNIWLSGMPNFSEIGLDGPAKNFCAPKFLDVVFDETINITWTIKLHKGCHASLLALQSAMSQTLVPHNYRLCTLQRKAQYNRADIDVHNTSRVKDATLIFDVLMRCPMKGKNCAGQMINLSNISIPRSDKLQKKVIKFYGIDPAGWDAWRNLHFKRCAEVRKFLVVRRTFAFKYGIPLKTSADLLSCEYCEAVKEIGFWVKDRCGTCLARKCEHEACNGRYDIPQAYLDLMRRKRKVYAHNGNTCIEYAELAEVGEEGLTMRLIKTLKRCPKCQIPAILREGCNHITCVCKADWCYACGKELIAADLGNNVYNHYKSSYVQNPCNQYQNNR